MSNNEEDDCLEDIMTAIANYSRASGEKPTIPFKIGDEEYLCHKSVLELKCPKLLQLLVELEKNALDISDKKIKENMEHIMHFIYWGKMNSSFEIVDKGLAEAAVCIGLVNLARLVVKALKLNRKDKLTFVGWEDGSESCIYKMNHEEPLLFLDKTSLNLRHLVDSDLFDYNGRRLTLKSSPKEIGMVEDELNLLEFDKKTFSLMLAPENETRNFVNIDFEIDRLDHRKGSFLSKQVLVPSLNSSVSWRVKIVFPKSCKSMSSKVTVGMYLLADGGGKRWSCKASGNLILVNQLDRSKDIVGSFVSNTRFGNFKAGLGWDAFAKLSDIRDPSKGFVKDGTLICKARVFTDSCKMDESLRYAQMMERRNRKQNKDGEGISSVHQSTETRHGKEQLIPDIALSKLKKNVRILPQNITENILVSEPFEVKTVNYICSNPEEVIVSEFGEEKNRLVESHSDKTNSDDVFKFALCQSLVATSESKTLITDDSKKSEQIESNAGKTSSKRKLRKKPHVKCYIPSCIEAARHRCSLCLGVSFCSQACSDEYWPEHRGECSIIRERKESDRLHGLD